MGVLLERDPLDQGDNKGTIKRYGFGIRTCSVYMAPRGTFAVICMQEDGRKEIGEGIMHKGNVKMSNY